MPRLAFILALVLLAFFSPLASNQSGLVAAQDATPPAACPQTSEEENAALALRWHEEAINGHDPTVIDEIFSDDVIHHSGTLPDGVGLDAVRRVLGVLLGGFPDVKHTVEDVIVDGDKVVTRWTAEGTQEGEFQGFAPTGKHVTWTGINIFRIECGKIAEEWSEVDGLGRVAQLEAPATPAP